MDDVAKIVKLVSERMSDREVTSEEEIKRNAMRCMLKYFGTRSVGFDYSEMLSSVVESLCSEPLSIHSLHYSEELEIESVKFRHTHTCKLTKDKFESAYDEYVKSKRLIDSFETMIEVTDRFFEGYRVKDGLIREYRKDKYKYGIYYSLIDDVAEDIETHKGIAERFDGEYVIVVLTEKEITNFLRFFVRHSEDVKRSGFKIWVVNAKEKSIDPFIGYPKDFRLINKFKNPKLATIINSLWRVKVEELE